MNQQDPQSIHFSYQCVPCSLKSLIKLYDQGIVPLEKQGEAMQVVLDYLRKLKFSQPPALVNREMHRILRKLLNDPDPYRKIKAEYNRALLEAYPVLKRAVDEAPDPLQMALKLAVLLNQMDFLPLSTPAPETILNRIGTLKLALDESEAFRSALKESRKLLYLGDNAGEVVADRILLETIGHPEAYFGVRGSPILNDATLEDALQAGLDRVATIVPNGDDAPGTLIEYTSPEFQDIFHDADLIVAKGQGNFSCLMSHRKGIFFLFKVKCDHFAMILKVRREDFVVTRR